MAKKGQKFRSYDTEFKEMVYAEYKKGYSARYLGEKYGVSHKTIETWVLKYRMDGTFEPRQKGRPKGTVDYKEKYEILKKFQDFLKEVDPEKK